MPILCGLRGNSSLPNPAQTPLVKAADALIEVLDEVDHFPALYLNHQVLHKAIFRYEHRWIPLLASVPAAKRLTLVPPLDVEWVWFCHMLCPVKYITDSAAMWNAVRPDEHGTIVDHKLTPSAERQEGKRRATILWVEKYPDESFDILQSLRDAPLRASYIKSERKMTKQRKVLESRISYNIIAAAERQMAFHYQVAIMPQYRDKTFLRHAVKRYSNMFLKLHKRFPYEIWVPTCDIDLIWHAHMMHPRWYKESTEKLRGSILPYDDMLNIRSTGSQLKVRWNVTIGRWTKMFRNEPLIREGGMWRGDIKAEERMERPRIKRLIQVVQNRALTSLEKYSGSKPRLENRVRNGIQFSVVYGGDANWKDTQIEWVHMTDLRRANRIGRTPPEGRENKIERITFLKYADQPNLLTCRTIHFLMYRNWDEPCNFGTILEVFGVGASPDIPLATAQYVLPHNLCKMELTTSTSCTRRFNENVLLLRVGGEDFGLLLGKWTGFIAPRKNAGLHEAAKQPPGQLELRLWLLGNNSIEQWLTLRKNGSSKEPGQYSFELPVLDDGSITKTAPVEFDLKNGIVFVGHATHVVAAYLISMAAAALHVTLQPRFAPKGWCYMNTTQTMYPEWSVPQNPYDMLRGAGGEIKGIVGNRGLWIMLLQILQSSKGTSGSSFSFSFSGSSEDIRTSVGSVVGRSGLLGGASVSGGWGDFVFLAAATAASFGVGC